MRIVFLVLISLIVAGCATYTSQTASLRASWKAGDVSVAEVKVKKATNDSNDSDMLIWLLEEGAIARANADFISSKKSFKKAFEKICYYENQPKVRLTEEATSFFTNQSYTDYKGYNYDKIMLCIYQALNYIETKCFDEAAVELKRLQNFQDSAKHYNLERIQEKSDALKSAQAKSSVNSVNALQSISAVEAQLKIIYGNAYKTDVSRQSEALYVNPFGYWLGGLFFANYAQTRADIELSASMFRNCSEILGNKSSAIIEDITAIEAMANGKSQSMGNITYIIWETGVAPIKKQVRLDLPIFVVARNAPHIAVNFPYLQKQSSFRSRLNVVAGNKNINFDTIADLDAIIQEEFDIELPYVITRSILSAAAKSTGEYFAARAAGDYGILVHAAMGLYQSLMNDADLRIWTTLPKQIKIARFATPLNCKINIEGKIVDVDKQGVNVIYVKTMGGTGNIIIRKFDFKKKKTDISKIKQN
ncbi:MAG: hypothetical protein J6B07_05175 [Opitutales bacterium]|nr:hypothetical protein [Opitutales bacterium]